MGRPKKEKFKFVCSYCDYKTSTKSNWNKHIKTAKHLKKVKLSFKYSENKQGHILCNFCGKTYTHRSSYSRHKKKCKAYLDGKKANFSEEKVCKKITDQVTIADKDAIMQKIENIENKIENNLNLNINNTNNITINMFLNEHCKDALNLEDFIEKIKITLNDLMETKALGYAKGISNILIQNLKELPTLERPIHCIDKNALEFVVKEHNEWNKEDGSKKVDKVINSISKERIKRLQEWKDKNPNYQTNDKLYEMHNEIVENIMDVGEDEEGVWKDKVKKDLGEVTEIEKAIEKIC
jgi:hypothetical protein